MRRDGWEDRLHAVVERHRGQPYAAGVSDCFTMAMEAVEAVTGRRPYASVRYRSDARGFAIMKKKGFADLREAVAAIFLERPRAMAMRGDIAVLDGTAGPTLGVVLNGGIAWKNRDVAILPLSAAVAVYAVD